METRYDTATINKFDVDSQTGFLHVNHVPIARVGVFPYLNSDGEIVKEAKTPTELLSDSTVESANDKPVTNDHPHELVTKDNVDGYMKGFTAENAHVENGRLYNDLTITDADLIKAISKGKQELSIGFQTDIQPAKGELNGVKYDALQRNIQINHVAVVDRGRAGHSVRLTADSAEMVSDDEQKGQNMAKKLRKVVADADNSDTPATNNSGSSSSSSNSNSSASGNSSEQQQQDPKDALIAQLKAQVLDLQNQLKELKAKQNPDNDNSGDNSNSGSDDDKNNQAQDDALIDSLRSKLKQANEKLDSYKGDALDKKIEAKLDLESKVRKLVGDNYDIKDKNGKLKSNRQMKIDAIKATENVPKDFDEKAKQDMYVDTYFDIIQSRKPNKVVGLTDNMMSDNKASLKAKADKLLNERYNLANNRKEDK